MNTVSTSSERDAPLVSVLICTRNRERYLADAIQSALDQQAHGIKYEIIVVDNGSSDRTREVTEGFMAAGNIYYVYEPAVGLCNARNARWRSARGRYVAYLDDDAIACPSWLASIAESFASTPNLGIVGGRVDPIWEGPRPAWLSDDIALSLTILDWSSVPKLITDVRVEWLVGANMAAPAAVLAEVGGFHPWLDRVGTRMLSSGDVFLQKQIVARGYTCLYHPDMAVRHRVPESRLTKGWFVRRYYSQGLSDAAMQLIEESPSKRGRAGHAFSLASRLLRSPRKLSSLVVCGNDPQRFREKCFSLITVGHIAGLLGALGR